MVLWCSVCKLTPAQASIVDLPSDDDGDVPSDPNPTRTTPAFLKAHALMVEEMDARPSPAVQMDARPSPAAQASLKQ